MSINDQIAYITSTLDKDSQQTFDLHDSYRQAHFKIKKDHVASLTSAFILVGINADLRSNSELLTVNTTLRAAKINVLDGYAYPELRLYKCVLRLYSSHKF